MLFAQLVGSIVFSLCSHSGHILPRLSIGLNYFDICFPMLHDINPESIPIYNSCNWHPTTARRCIRKAAGATQMVVACNRPAVVLQVYSNHRSQLLLQWPEPPSSNGCERADARDDVGDHVDHRPMTQLRLRSTQLLEVIHRYLHHQYTILIAKKQEMRCSDYLRRCMADLAA